MESLKAVIIIIRDKNSNYFVHQRNSEKRIFPNIFGLGAGGHIEKSETPKMAAKRELFEETGLETELKYLFKIIYESKDFKNEMEIFETETDLDMLKTDNGEWQWCGWMTQDEVDVLSDENKLCPDTAKVYKKYISQNN